MNRIRAKLKKGERLRWQAAEAWQPCLRAIPFGRAML